MQKIAVIGLGLMGGSIVKALKRSSKYYVIGYNRTSSVTDAALKESAIDEAWDGSSPIDADITILAVNPNVAYKLLETLPALLKKGSILTDICGVKEEVVRLGEAACGRYGIRFVGGHPMAGRERSGYEFSTPDLFFNRSYIFTETNNTDKEAINLLSQMALDIGCADVTITSPAYHDKMIAYTSQIPHILAGAYMNSPTSATHKGYSAGSYHDVSRVASVDENLWTQLFMANKDNLLYEIDILIRNLEDYKEAVARNDTSRLSGIIKTGRILKERDIIVNGDEKPHKFG
ncbi:MAG: prephenate dehydrogenase/arogenate dehydrogenase family protein [Acutalibacteraceae bacterium]|nr:prephenate dehydrogenase/arogenate dehydrogenase family protein [Acutalibacteraceae bacterium]